MPEIVCAIVRVTDATPEPVVSVTVPQMLPPAGCAAARAGSRVPGAVVVAAVVDRELDVGGGRRAVGHDRERVGRGARGREGDAVRGRDRLRAGRADRHAGAVEAVGLGLVVSAARVRAGVRAAAEQRREGHRADAGVGVAGRGLERKRALAGGLQVQGLRAGVVVLRGGAAHRDRSGDRDRRRAVVDQDRADRRRRLVADVVGCNRGERVAVTVGQGRVVPGDRVDARDRAVWWRRSARRTGRCSSGRNPRAGSRRTHRTRRSTPEPASVGEAETTTPLATFAPSAGPPRLKAAGSAPSASIVSESLPVIGPGMVSPLNAVTVSEPGEEIGLPLPSKL